MIRSKSHLLRFSAAAAAAAFALCALLVPGRGFGADSLCARFDCGKNLSPLIYEVPYGKVVNKILGGRLSSDVTFSMKLDRGTGNWIFHTKSSYHEAVSILDSSLRTREHTYRVRIADVEKHIKDPEIRKLMLNTDYDGYRAVWDWKKKSISLKYFREGRLKKTESIGFSGHLMDVGHFYVYLQGLLLAGFRQDFENEVFITSKGWKVRVGFRFIRTSRPTELNPAVKQRKDMLPAFLPGRTYFVYEMKPVGFVGFFARLVTGIRYYAAFESWPPYRFVAIWGGPRDHEDLTWVSPGGRR